MCYIHLKGSWDQLPIYPHQPRVHRGRILEFQRAELLKPGQKSEVSILELGTYMAMTEDGPRRFHYKISKPELGWVSSDESGSAEEDKPVFSQSPKHNPWISDESGSAEEHQPASPHSPDSAGSCKAVYNQSAEKSTLDLSSPAASDGESEISVWSPFPEGKYVIVIFMFVLIFM